MENDSQAAQKVYTFVGFSKKSFCFRAKMKEFPETFICQVCNFIAPKIRTLPCGHWTCDVCLKGLKYKDKKLPGKVFKCALCKQTSREVTMTTTVLKSHIQKKPAVCAQTGCAFSGALRDIKRHSPFCATHSIVPCEGCGNTLQRAALSRHLREQCTVDAPLPEPGSS